MEENNVIVEKPEVKQKISPKEYQKEYYQKKKMEILEKGSHKNVCEICKGKFTNANKSKHILTKKHINSLEIIHNYEQKQK